MELSAAQLTYITNHVFLPPNLPQEYDAEDPENDGALLECVRRAAVKFCNELQDSSTDEALSVLPTWTIILSMLESVKELHSRPSLRERDIAESFQLMQKNDVLPLYIAAQNAIVIFRRISEDWMTFEHFEATLPADEVMKKCKKTRMQFPTNPRLLLAWRPDVIAGLANILSYLSVDHSDEALQKPSGIPRRSTPKAGSPRFISEALAGLIRGSQPPDTRPCPTTYIIKRLNDHVLGRSAERPWRRSPLWLLVRVAIQTTLAEAQIPAGYGYKAFQAFFLSRILLHAANYHPGEMSNDSLWFMNAKLARRLVKLGSPMEDESNKALRSAGEMVHQISLFLKDRWNEVKDAWASRVQWSELTPAILEDCNVTTFPNSQEYLHKFVNRQHQLDQIVVSFDRNRAEETLMAACADRAAYSPHAFPSIIYQREPNIGLYDFEIWVRDHLQQWVASPSRSESDCLGLGLRIQEYRSKASIQYQGNPECLSMMHLCIIELWVAVDRLLSNWCRLILEYSPGIPSSYLDPLILPYRHQMERLHKVQQYLKERHRNAHNKSVFEDINSTTSFANEFYESLQGRQLQQLESRIRSEARRKRIDKLAELRNLNEQHSNYMSRSEALQCQYIDRVDANGLISRNHSGSCEKCRLASLASKLDIAPIEEPLPDNVERARTIIFELRCPQSFAIWRDIVQSILQGITFISRSPIPLSSYTPLRRYYISAYPNQCVQLGSSKRPFTSTRKNRVSIPAEEDSVVLKCAGNFSLYDSYTHRWIAGMGTPELGKLCIFQLSGVYAPLQNFLNTTTHTPNQVIASQHTCPPGLSVEELLAFGHLRAGNWLQWRNIIRALRTQSLTFSESNVYFLILQAIWQAGTTGTEGFYREAHSDLLDGDFCRQALNELEFVVNNIGDNWMQVFLLASVVALTVRIHNLTPVQSLRQHALNVLNGVRSVASDWMRTLQGVRLSQESTKTQPRHALIATSFVLRATFDIERSHGTSPFQSEEEVTEFLYAGTFISDIPINDLPHGVRLLAHRDQRIALSLEPYISSLCRNSDILHNVILSKWSRYRPGSNWVQLPSPADRWWVTTTRASATSNSQVIHLNIVSGSFLTDGKPFDRLPLEYVSHPTYHALFGPEGIVGVAPSNMRGMTYGGYHKNHEIHLSLTQQELIIRCRQEDEIEEFVPSSALARDLPRNLIDGNHYWYKEGANCIEIRPRPQTWSRDVPKVWKIALRLHEHQLVGMVSKELESGTSQLVDIHSVLYKHLSHTLQSLEPHSDGLLVTVDQEHLVSQPSVYLPRHDLTFRVNSSNRLECQSFPGFVLDLNFRGISTLIGLKTMVSLRNGDDMSSQRKIIVPKGAISTTLELHGHPSITIALREQGGYFAYDIDDILGRLQGSRSVESDLFLVQLHAVTSSSLPDDLTGRSGTNEALDYLSSSSSFSMYAISEEARGYLDNLAALTPARTNLSPSPQITETVKWDPNLPILSQHPAFLHLVESILEYWRKFAVFHPLGDLLKPIKLPSGMNFWSARARARNWVFHHASYSGETLEDSLYQPRDCMRYMESQERERLAFQVACLCQPSTMAFPHFLSPSSEVIRWRSIQAAGNWNWGNISQWLPHAKSMGKIWQNLYKLCSEVIWPPNFQVITALSLLGYCEAPFEFLATLIALARRPHLVPPCPSLAFSLDLGEGREFDTEKIRRILANYVVAYEQSLESRIEQRPNEGGHAWDTRVRQARRTYQENLTQQINQVIAEMRNHWPNVSGRFSLSAKRLLILDGECIQRLHSTLRGWLLNKAFLDHIGSLPTAVAVTHAQHINWALYSPAPDVPTRNFDGFGPLTIKDLLNRQPAPPHRPSSMDQGPNRVLRPRPADIPDDLTRLLNHINESAQSELEQRYVSNLSDSINAPRPPSDARTRLPTLNVLKASVEVAKAAHTIELNRLADALSSREYALILQEAAGLSTALTPVILLRQLSRKNRKHLPQAWENCIIDYAIRVHDAKRKQKMLQFCQTDRLSQLSIEHHYRREWDPALHPDWLLIEIDSNFSIRPEQAIIASEMLAPVNGQNSVMQLNMGEGKSSVIVPIVSASTAFFYEALSRIIVPRSQLKQQFHILRQTVTNLCNRPVFHMPFMRNLKLDLISVQQLRKFLEMAQYEGAIWLCEPEQLLSLKLLGCDRSLRDQSEISVGQPLIELQSWLQDNTRDIIDESDEVLHPRQQVIYTVGEQKAFDGAPWRWEITQKLLGLLEVHLRQLQNPSNEAIPFMIEYSGNPCSFPASIRFEDNCGPIIREFIDQSILQNDWSLRPDLIDLCHSFVTAETFPEDIHRQFLQRCPGPSSHVLHTALILRGILQNNLILHIFKDKRYRVNYGLDLGRTLLAVPYRAKDLPSPRSEFGHPEVVIILTCLSYYYGGLSTEMIKQTLEHLQKSGTPDLTYQEWLRPCWDQVEPQLRTLRGLNMQDDKILEEHLFPLLKYNKLFIDSYLNWVVFPRHAKEFPSKLSSSGWDLAMKKTHVTTGFSGTNDGRFLLPTTITQLDRPPQLHTNAKVLSYLLQRENSSVHSYPHTSSSSLLLNEILSLEPRPTVILDVGAQVLDKSNKEFSRLWLSHYQDHPVIKAIIFFNEDELTVMTPDGLSRPLMDSPYAERLDQCLVYLDDAHTRGTDLRLPNVRAVVTLGPRLTKDKLVQGAPLSRTK
ncbi:hypothetical protein CPB86DRAFT_53513 [Serendipita vermifera]|nr:hypothetical protein CPB86DRAFT_53513 [Serendipita vermifera]